MLFNKLPEFCYIFAEPYTDSFGIAYSGVVTSAKLSPIYPYCISVFY